MENFFKDDVNKLKDKIEILPGIIATPLKFNSSELDEIKSTIITKMIKPIQTILGVKYQQIIGLFISMDLDIKIWDMYNFRNELNPTDIKMYNIMCRNDGNLKSILSFKNTDEINNGYLVYRSGLKITKQQLPVIVIDLFKPATVEISEFIKDVTRKDRQTLMFIYLKELIEMITKSFKNKSIIKKLIKSSLKSNKNFNGVDLPDTMESQLIEAMTVVINTMFTNNLLFENLLSNLYIESNYDNNVNSDYARYIMNPLSNYNNKSSECFRTLSNFLSNIDTDTTHASVLEFSQFVVNSSTPIYFTKLNLENPDALPEREVIGFKILDKIFLTQSSNSDYYNDNKELSDNVINDIWVNASNSVINKLMGVGCVDIFSGLGIPIQIEMGWAKQIIQKVINTYDGKSRKTSVQWSRPNILTKHIANLPNITHYKSDVKVHIAIDSSGSMADEDLEKINYMIEIFSKKSISMVLYIHDGDDNVNVININSIKDSNEFIKNRYKCGGTSHVGVFRKIEENLKNGNERRKAIVVVASDLYSDIDTCYKDFSWTKTVHTYFVSRTTTISVPFGELVIIS